MTDVDLSSPAVHERGPAPRVTEAYALRRTAPTGRAAADEGARRLAEAVAAATDLGLRRIDVRNRARRRSQDIGAVDHALHRVAAAWAGGGLDVALGRDATRRGRPDGVVEVWESVPALAARWVRRPTIFLVDPPSTDRLWQEPVRNGFHDALVRRGSAYLHRRHRVVTGSWSSMDRVVARLGCDPGRVEVVARGIDRPFSPGGRRAGDPLVVAAGQLVPDGRTELLVELLVDAKRFVPRLHAVVIGDGPEHHRLLDAIARADAADWLQSSATLSDAELATVFRRAWVVASTAVRGGWDIRIPDAAACATPSVASNIADHRACVTHEVSGLLAEPGHEFVAALVRVLTDDVLRARLGSGALAQARCLSWEASAAAILSALVDEARARS